MHKRTTPGAEKLKDFSLDKLDQKSPKHERAPSLKSRQESISKMANEIRDAIRLGDSDSIEQIFFHSRDVSLLKDELIQYFQTACQDLPQQPLKKKDHRIMHHAFFEMVLFCCQPLQSQGVIQYSLQYAQQLKMLRLIEKVMKAFPFITNDDICSRGYCKALQSAANSPTLYIAHVIEVAAFYGHVNLMRLFYSAGCITAENNPQVRIAASLGKQLSLLEELNLVLPVNIDDIEATPPLELFFTSSESTLAELLGDSLSKLQNDSSSHSIDSEEETDGHVVKRARIS